MTKEIRNEFVIFGAREVTRDDSSAGIVPVRDDKDER